MVRFGPFAVDIDRVTLTRDSVAIDLLPRGIEILAHLASHPGVVFSKTALLDKFWGDTAVTDNTIEQVIGAIRKALGDGPANPRYIETVKRRGYRFIAIVDTRCAVRPDAFDDWTRGLMSFESLDAGQLHETTAMFERVLEKNPQFPPAHAAVANGYFFQYELTRPEVLPNRALLDRALYHGQQACTLDKGYAEGWGTLGLVLTAAGEVEQARVAAMFAAVFQPDNWRHHFRLGVASWGQRRLDAVHRVMELIPDFAPARFLAATVFIARQAFAAAEERVAKGAVRQTQDANGDSPLPAFGLHWARGLLQLRSGQITEALASFDREINEARRTSLYYPEYRVNALIGSGYAHLAAGDLEAAAVAFRAVLETMPGNGRALLGMVHATTRNGRKSDAKSFAARVDDTIAQLTKGARLAEAAMLRASVEAARGDAKAAARILEEMLKKAPVSQVGWTIPIEPAFSPIRDDAAFASTLALLSARAC